MAFRWDLGRQFWGKKEYQWCCVGVVWESCVLRELCKSCVSELCVKRVVCYESRVLRGGLAHAHHLPLLGCIACVRLPYIVCLLPSSNRHNNTVWTACAPNENVPSSSPLPLLPRRASARALASCERSERRERKEGGVRVWTAKKLH